MKTSSIAVETSRSISQSDSIVRQTNKLLFLSDTTMNNMHIFNDNIVLKLKFPEVFGKGRQELGWIHCDQSIMTNSYPVNNLKNVIGCPLCCCYVIKIWTSLAQLHGTKHDRKKYLLKINSWSIHVSSIWVTVCEGLIAIRSGINIL